MKTKHYTPRHESRPLLGITMGDPAGIGPEVSAKALTGAGLRKVCFPLVVGSLSVMRQTVKKLKSSCEPAIRCSILSLKLSRISSL